MALLRRKFIENWHSRFNVTDKIFVYDGDDAYKEGTYHVVYTSKNATVGAALVSICMISISISICIIIVFVLYVFFFSYSKLVKTSIQVRVY